MSQQVIEGFRLSPQQKSLWLRRGGTSAVVQAIVDVAGPLAAERLQLTIGAAVARHEILHTRFERLPGMEVPIQVIAEDAPWVWSRVELSVCGAQATTAEIERLAAAQRRPFALERGPVVRAVLVDCAPQRHVLVLTLPALCADSRSLDNLVAEIARGYLGLPGGDEPAEEPLQYVQFSEWQNEICEEPGEEEEREFWQRRGKARPAAVEMPLERSGIAAESIVALDLAAAEVTAAEEIAVRHGATLRSLLLMCWVALLARLTGRSDLTVEVFFDGRKYDELAGALGPLGQYIPLTLRARPDRPFAHELARAARLLEEARAAEEFFVRPESEEGALPNSAIGFDFEQAAGAPAAGAGVTFTVAGKRLDDDGFQLRLSALRRPGELRLELRARLYDLGGLRRLSARLHTLWRGIVAQPEAAVAELTVLSNEERRLLDEWNRTAAEVPEPHCLPQLFAEVVGRAPDAVAVVDRTGHLSFRHLAARAEQLAGQLGAHGVAAESRVGLLLERSNELIVALLAVWKAGAAYLPLDLWQPRERLVRMLADAGAKCVVGQLSLRDRLPQKELPTLWIDSGGAAAEPPRKLTPPQPQSLAYVIYTSGSTGRPKATMVEHRSLANLAFALRTAVYGELAEGAGLRVGVNAPLAFDASVKQVIQLFSGHTLVMIPEEVRADGEAVLAWLSRYRVDVFDCTPSQLRLLLDAGLCAGGAPFPRLVLVGGEAVDGPTWEALASDESRRFYNVYGPTECTVDASVVRVTAAGAPHIGRAIPNVHLQVLDADSRRVPLGVAGELWIGGAGVARGYLGRPALTAERFSPDPLAAVPGKRLYRSGDRVRWRVAGDLEFLGRLDHQVKVRGVRIELGEIEAALVEHPGVAEAVAVVREDRPGDQRLVAYAVPRWGRAELAGQRRYELPNGLAVAQQNRNETDYLYEEIFVKRCYVQHGIALPAAACVFDVGANIGLFTLFVHRECAAPRVYAFEPVPAIFDTLRLNRDLHAPETRLFSCGLSDSEKSERFTYYPRYSMMSGQSEYARPESEAEVVKRYLENLERQGSLDGEALLAEADELLAGRFEGEEVVVRLRRLSEVMREEGVEHIDLLKVDVQRGELDVLRGIDDGDWPKIDQVVLEVHDAPGEASEGRVAQIEALLGRRGFEVVADQDALLTGTDRYNVYARRRGLASRPAAAVPRGVAAGAARSEISPAILRDFLRQCLPEYMLPAAVLLLPALPLNRSGKVDRGALPAPEEIEGPPAEVEAPRTQFEEVLAGLWSELLGVAEVGTEASFFELGGHSLNATQLMSRLREVFDIDLPLRTLFEAPTLAGLAKRVEQAYQTDQRNTVPSLRPVARDGDLPLSFSQQRLWFVHQLEPDSPSYNSLKPLRLSGDLDLGVLRRTLDECVRRHEVLRTTFPVVAGEPVQRIHPPRPVPLPIVDLSDLEVEARQAVVRRLATAAARRPFDLGRGPLLRVTLLHLAAADHVILLTMHHIVTDAWSLGVLVREVVALYGAFLEGRSSPLEDLQIQYADFAHWQRRWLSGEVLDQELEYWSRQLGGELPVLKLPTDRPRPAVLLAQGKSAVFHLPAEVRAGLRRISRQQGVTMFMVLLAAFQTLLHRYTRQDDIAVGVPIAGRNRRETEPLIGCFINMLVLRTDLSGNPRFSELLQQVRKVALGAFAHQDLPFEKLIEELRPDRSSNQPSLFQVAFGVQNAPSEKLDLPGLEISGVDGVHHESVRFELTLHMVEVGESLTAAWSYNSILFEASTIERMHRHFKQVLLQVAVRPDHRLADLEILTEDEKAERERQQRELKRSGRQRFLAARPRAAS